LSPKLSKFDTKTEIGERHANIMQRLRSKVHRNSKWEGESKFGQMGAGLTTPGGRSRTLKGLFKLARATEVLDDLGPKVSQKRSRKRSNEQMSEQARLTTGAYKLESLQNKHRSDCAGLEDPFVISSSQIAERKTELEIPVVNIAPARRGRGRVATRWELHSFLLTTTSTLLSFSLQREFTVVSGLRSLSLYLSYLASRAPYHTLLSAQSSKTESALSKPGRAGRR
jgi:hypothetical protein